METTQMFLLGASTLFLLAWLAGGFTIIFKKLYDVDLTIIIFGAFSIIILVMWANFVLRITGL